ETFIQTQALSHINAVPSFLETIPVKKYPGLKRIVSGGETCPPALLKKWTAYCDFYNQYGPTETTVTSLKLQVKKGSDIEKVTIGKPLDNTTLYVLDNQMNPVPLKVPGELYIGGSGITRGYMNRPQLTAERFVEAGSLPNNQYPITNNQLYKTGDLVRWQTDGNIEYMGRVDRQVKIRGYRIELGEIENRLLEHKHVKQAAVMALENKTGVAHRTGTGEKYLCAYVVPEQAATLEKESLTEYLSKQLPQYMVPTYIVEIAQIPLTPNGKIDTGALPEPEIDESETHIAPGNETEKKLAQIWAGVLGIPQEKIGIDTDFFRIGGHSLKATVTVSRIHKELGVKVPLAEMFQKPTIRTMAQYISTAVKSKYARIEPVEKREYYPLSPAQKRLYILQ
ncbi:MAG: non-ribosomal peptide synthetase, partial [bacterium]|nr:non-ribosomal peptide synthetase [bacterium]